MFSKKKALIETALCNLASGSDLKPFADEGKRHGLTLVGAGSHLLGTLYYSVVKIKV